MLCCGQKLLGAARVALQLCGSHPELEGHGDQSLLGAVVEVALESATLGVADLDEFGTRCSQPFARVGVGERLADEVREVAQPPLETVREPLLRPRGRYERAPQPPGHGHRCRNRRAVARVEQCLSQASARLVVALYALGGAGTQHLREDRAAVEVDPRAHGKE